MIAADVVDRELVARVGRRILATLAEAPDSAMARSELRRSLSARQRQHMDDAFAALASAGRIRLDDADYQGARGQRVILLSAP